MFTIENFIKGIQATTQGILVENQSDKLILVRLFRDIETSEEQKQVIGEIPLIELQRLEAELVNDFVCNELMLLGISSFEVAVQAHDRMRIPSFRPDRDMYAISEHNYEFVLSKASTRYIFALLCYSAQRSDDSTVFDPINFRIYHQEISSAEELFELFRIFTVKISTNKRHSITEFKTHAICLSI